MPPGQEWWTIRKVAYGHMMNPPPVLYPHQECIKKQCQYTACNTLLRKADQRMESANEALKETRRLENRRMAAALWCDKGDHPFSAKDHYEEFTRTVKDSETGRATYVEYVICYKHTVEFVKELESGM